ncbi:membrane protein [gut metagenome]|uniref:Membrane protein n=1 Tax=gut metagenome TaxID=749906 RepID=J9G6J0_9ZZZZ
MNPRAPAELQETAFPPSSVIVTIVLLKVEWMCAIPLAIFFLTRRFLTCCCFFAILCHLSFLFLLVCYCFSFTLTSTCVSLCALSTNRQTFTVTDTSVATDFHQTFDVQLNFTTKVTFDFNLINCFS